MVVEEVVAGEAGEDVQDAGGGGRGAAAVFGVSESCLIPLLFTAFPDSAFDERVDEHGDQVAAQQGFDAGGVVQKHGCDQLAAFELRVALFQVGLVFVGGEQLRAVRSRSLLISG